MDYKEIISEARPTLKELSIKSYVSKLKAMDKLISEWTSKSVDDLINSIEYLDKKDLYKKGLLTAVIVLYSSIDRPQEDIDKLKLKLKEMTDEYYKLNNINTDTLASENQQNNIISYEELLQYVNELSKHTETQQEHMIYVIMKLHIGFPYRNDLANIRYIGKREFNKVDKSQNNYLYEDKKKLSWYFHQDETTKTKPDEFQSLSSSASKLVRAYIKKWNIKKGETLFPITKNNLSQVLSKTSLKYIGKSISTLLIRKIVVSHKFGGNHKEKVKEQEVFAKKIGHSVVMENAVYNKVLPR